MSKHDWTDIKAEYAATCISYRQLAEKHGISFNTLKDRAKKDNWSASRKGQRENVVKKTLHKVATKAATSCAKQLESCARSAEAATSVIERMMKDSEQFRRHLVQTKDKVGFDEHWDVEERQFDKFDTKALKDFTTSLKDLVSVIRNVNSLPTVIEQSAMDLAVKRLLMDEKKSGMGDGDDSETGVLVLPQTMPDDEDCLEVTE